MLDFPGPGGLTVGQIFTSAGKSWQWDGAKWAAAAGGGAPLDSPSFTGDPKAPTPSTGDNDTSIATTAFVKAQGYLLNNQVITLSGDLSGSGATAITTTLATVNSNVGAFQGLTVNAKGLVTGAVDQGYQTAAQVATALAPYAPLVSPVFTGDPRAPTPASADSDTSIATTAFVKAQNYVTGGPYLPTAGGTVTGALTVNNDLSVGATGNIILSNNHGLYGKDTGGATRNLIGLASDNLIRVGPTSGAQTLYLAPTHTFFDAASSVVYAQFSSSGTYNVSGAWLTFSDAALKENVVPYERGLAAIMELRPVTFTYVAGTPFADENSTPRIGLLAQEAEAVVPEIVGQIDTEAHGTVKTLESGTLIYALINAVKELAARIEHLEAAPPAA